MLESELGMHAREGRKHRCASLAGGPCVGEGPIVSRLACLGQMPWPAGGLDFAAVGPRKWAPK